jgi:hypothetical protein
MKNKLIILSLGLIVFASNAQQDVPEQNAPPMSHGQMDHAAHMAQIQAQRQSEVAALHKWFDAQVSDHGKDAMKGHNHKH